MINIINYRNFHKELKELMLIEFWICILRDVKISVLIISQTKHLNFLKRFKNPVNPEKLISLNLALVQIQQKYSAKLYNK